MTQSTIVNAAASCTQTSQLVELVLMLLLTLLGEKLASGALDFEGVLSDGYVLIVAVAHS